MDLTKTKIKKGKEMKNFINKKIYIHLIIIIISTSYLFSAEIINQDKPAKGEYTFPLESIWSVNGIGERPFGLVVTIRISDSNHVFCRDLKNKEYYVFNENGKFISKFGALGEGPGEVKNIGFADISVVNNKVIIQDSDKLLYFDDQGKFLRSIRYYGSANIILNENEIISAPQGILRLNSDKAKMKHINLKTKEEKEIADFTMFKSGAINQDNIRASVVLPIITPVMVVGNHSGKIYFGMNNKYEIFITDINGKKYGSFQLKRKSKSVSLKVREDFMIELAKGMAPADLARRLAKTLPDKETYFSGIWSHEGLLYVYRSHFPPENQQQIDIFSSEGKYLCKAFVKLQKGNTIIAGPRFKNNHIYLALEDEEGEIFVNKYETVLPVK